MVYFVRLVSSGLIKIGYSSCVPVRMQQLRFDHGPLVLLLVLLGSVETERAHHRHFASLRVKGEWFEPGDDLLAYIASLPSCEPVGPIGHQRPERPIPRVMYVAQPAAPSPTGGRLTMTAESTAPRWARVYR